MFVIIGYIVVIASVLGGFALAGGNIAVLMQPLEVLMIGGAALGAFLVGNNSKSIKATLQALPTLFKGSRYNRALYLDLMLLMFALLNKIRTDGMMAIEGDVEQPEQSELFSKYPLVLADHHLLEFITDYLRLMMSGNMDPFQLENLMDNEIDTHHAEGEVPVHCIAKLGDGLPAFGIVAAVMGVVHTMESVGLPPAELGILIAHALVGTFLGILLAYGFIGPLAGLLEQKLHESSKTFQCVKVTLLASLNGYPPTIAVEFGRKVLFSTERPSFAELEEQIKQAKSK
ncbi:flagellar motor stator protein MotA [Malikia spinosa]|uniref:Flagellar motor stator protein MotA n=1 Tax=Malikia spinosa TaxID=86180 RepID=A0A2S9KDD7_9BURK|nr:flagellar motor stator protein MotA [Malikia spinosa]MYZ52897.1 flagellar motor stator protein MotA [Malikia spinosa]OGB69614.1 MAG: flagellar motor stator protein MotA [Burkholderiales bacterium RIFOXYC12_FULL_65_23]PRD68467.1 flagellar motor stator protein MotA [Malikia spinosa]